MKTLKLFSVAAVSLLLVPAASFAGLLDILPIGGGDGSPAPVPEPSGALIMGAALLAVSVTRKLRK
jgi:hypothetical protein